MRALLAPLVLGAAALLLTAWASGDPTQNCTAADAREGKVLRQHNVMRSCGLARVIVRAGGRFYVIRGGVCFAPQGDDPAERWLMFGVFTPLAQPHSGLGLVVRPGDRAGRVSVIDGELQLVPGVRVALSGSAVVGSGLGRGTFSVYGRSAKGLTGGRFTGSWSCR
jgi:hypothetical protein